MHPSPGSNRFNLLSPPSLYHRDAPVIWMTGPIMDQPSTTSLQFHPGCTSVGRIYKGMKSIQDIIIAFRIQYYLLVNGPRHEVNHWKAANGFQEVVVRPVRNTEHRE